MTRDPDVVTVSNIQDRAYRPLVIGEPSDDAVFSVNISSGEVFRFSGRDARGIERNSTETGFLVMYSLEEDEAETTTCTVFDPVSGREVGTIANAPYPEAPVSSFPMTMAEAGNIFSISTPDGTAEVISIGFDQIYVMQYLDGDFTLRQIQPPAGIDPKMYLTRAFVLSSDGSWLSLFGENPVSARYLLRIDDPDAEWIEVPNTPAGEDVNYILFVEGAGDSE